MVIFLIKVQRCYRDLSSQADLAREIELEVIHISITAPFNYMRTLKFKAQSATVFFPNINRMFYSSSQHHNMLSELCSNN